MANYPQTQITMTDPAVGKIFAFSIPIIDASTGSNISGGINTSLTNYYVSGDRQQETVGVNPLTEGINPAGQGNGVLTVSLAPAEMNFSLVHVRVVAVGNNTGIHTCLIGNRSIRPRDYTEYPTGNQWMDNTTFPRMEQGIVQMSAVMMNQNQLNSSLNQISSRTGFLMLEGNLGFSFEQTLRSKLS